MLRGDGRWSSIGCRNSNPGAPTWNNSGGFSYDQAMFAADLGNISPSNPGSLSSTIPPLEPLWQLREGFDIPALDSSVSTAISDWWCPAGNVPGILQPEAFDEASHLGGDVNFDDTQSAVSAVVRVQQNWFTNMMPDATASSSARRSMQQNAVDDPYRELLTNRLQIQMIDETLPSADFLNLCIKLYFAKFRPIFPIMHASSFQPSSENALVLLSVCSMGALFVGSSSAASQGRKIFQRLNRAILASWENIITRGAAEVLSLAQAALIGQTFAMCSGHPADLCLAESFHGTVIAWARRGGMFQARETLSNPMDLDPEHVEKQWQTWIRAEETARVVLALHIHDAVFASTSHHEPLLRHDPSRLPSCCSEKAFSLPSAERWLALLTQPHTASPSHFRSDATLAGILAHIQELRADPFGPDHVRGRLISWMMNDAAPHALDQLCLLVLWHECFMATYADLDALERWIGRDGPAATGTADQAVCAWAACPVARFCVLHALLVQKRREALPAGAEPAIHVPRALFRSAVIVYTFIGEGVVLELGQGELSLPEMRLGRFGIARKFAAMLEALLNVGVGLQGANEYAGATF